MCQKCPIYPVSIEECCSWEDQTTYTFQFKKKKPTKEIEQIQNAILSRVKKRIIPRTLERIESYDKDGNLSADTMQCKISSTYYHAYTMHQHIKTHLKGIVSSSRYVLSMCEKAMTQEQFEQSLIENLVDFPVAYLFDGEDYTPNRKIVLIFGDNEAFRFFERHHEDGLFGWWRYNENHILCFNNLTIWDAMKEEK